MKRFLLTVIAVMTVLLLLVGCATAPAGEGMVIKGKKLTINIEENATTGYTWAYEVSDPAVLAASGDDYYEGANENGATGVGGIHSFSFTGVSAGTVTIVFTEGQQWDGGEKGDTITVNVSVAADGTIESAG